MAARDDLAPGPPSLVLTLEMDGEAFAVLDALRRRYYVPERNLVPAHLTLFYRLPGARAREIKAFLATVATERRPIEIPSGEVKATERGVALFLHSPQLAALRQELAREWSPWLDDADSRPFRPHVTIQAGVSESEARRTRQAVAATFRPPRLGGVGLHLWHYRQGPWESERLFRFRG